MPDYLEGALGILGLTGTEKLFAIDGQHRVAGIQQAIDGNKALGTEEVCVIFLAGVTAERRVDDPAGFERTRRLFTTLNRYAKPVSKRDIIALDEDDAIAIVTREMVEDHPLFRNKVSIKQPKSVPVSDKQSLTTIVALYDALDIYLRTSLKGWSKFKRLRPPDSTLKDFTAAAKALWKALTGEFPELREFAASKPEKEVAGKYRTSSGGHLLFRPVGFLQAIRVVRHLQDTGLPLAASVKRLSKLPMALDHEPWKGLLWDPTNKRMITAPENQRAALRLMVHGCGGDLEKFNSSEEELRSELAGLLNKRPEQVRLKKYT